MTKEEKVETWANIKKEGVDMDEELQAQKMEELAEMTKDTSPPPKRTRKASKVPK